MLHFLQSVFIIAWLTGVAFWGYGLVPFLRLQAHIGSRSGGNLLPLLGILRDRSHPMHPDAKRLARGWSGFLICWLIGAIIGVTTFARHGAAQQGAPRAAPRSSSRP